MLLQVGGAIPRSSLELLRQSSGETKIVLAITLLFSVVSWFIIGLKWWQFRRIRRQADRFFTELERTTRLQEAYTVLMKQPPSPYNRLFREGMNFYNELRPGVLREDPSAVRTSLEHDPARGPEDGARQGGLRRARARHSPRALAGHRSAPSGPLLGLLGTVLGIMDAFIGIAAKGSGNIAAVAPGVAEALITTVAGLATAIPAMMAYNYYVHRVRVFAGELEGFANELIGSMAREGLI